MRAAHFCQQCGKVQPPGPVDYFTFFGSPYRLNIDTAKLGARVLRLSRHLHPDINAISTPKEQEWSLEQSSSLNDAYRTLKDPDYAHRIPAAIAGRPPGRAVHGGDGRGAAYRQGEEASGAARSAGRGFRAEHAAGRSSHEQENGRTRPLAQLELQDTKKHLQAKYDGMMEELHSAWNDWDALVEQAAQGGNVLEEDRVAVRDKMLGILNRRNYVRNLLRDIEEVLE